MIDIDEKIKEARRERKSVDLKAWQNLKSQVQKFQTAKNPKLYDSTAQISILQKYCKSLQEAIQQFKEGGREDLCAEYKEELGVLEPYLPKTPDPDDITDTLVDWCDENRLTEEHELDLWNPAIPKKRMGDAIKFLREKFPTADGKTISDIVKHYLV